MATLSRGSFGGGNLAGGGGDLPPGFAAISPLVIPELMQLFQRAQASVPTEMNSLSSIVSGGANSPLLRAVLDPALARLQAPQAQQRQQFTEAARAAGGLRGSTYNQGYNTLLQNQGQQQNDLMGQVIQQILSPLISGQLQEQRNAFLPAEALTQLLQASRPQITGTGGGSSYSSAGGGGSNFLNEPFRDLYRELGIQRPGPDYNLGGGYSGVNYQPPAGGSSGGGANPYVPYLDPLGGGAGGGNYDIGGGTNYLRSPADVGGGYPNFDGMSTADPSAEFLRSLGIMPPAPYSGLDSTPWTPDPSVMEGWW